MECTSHGHRQRLPILIGKPENEAEADFSMHIYNADGSEAMMCGNGSRCVGKYVYDKGLTDKTTVRLETQSGVKILKLHVLDGAVDSVTVDMSAPMLENDEQFTLKSPATLEADATDSLQARLFLWVTLTSSLSSTTSIR